MATSGNFSTSNQYIKYRIVVTENSYSVANNTSNVTVAVQVWRTNTGYTTYGTGTCYVTIDGTSYSSKITTSQKFTYNSYTQVFSKTLTIAHNSNGSKSIYVSSYIDHSTFSSSSQGFTVALTTIPRYASSNQSLASKTETSIKMNWSSNSTVDYIWYSTNNGSSWTGINVADGTSGSYTISGLSANTSYNIKTRVRRKDSQLTTDSSTLSVTTYAYPYANSMPNFTIGNRLTLGIYNPLGRSVTVNILGADGSQCSNDTTSGTSITGYAGTGVTTALYASIPNAKSGTYRVKVTYGSQVSTKTGGTYTINTSACTPSITSVAYQDTNSTTTAITDDNQLIIRNQSTVQYSAAGLTVKNYATISSCSVSVNNNTYNLSVSGTSASGGNATIDSASNVTAVFTLTDSRGLTATTNIDISMLDWILPSAIITLQRQNNFYSETDINVDADYSSIDGKNTITIQARYKKASDTSYGSYVTLQDNVTSVLTLDNTYEWNVQVLLTDLFGSTTYNLTVQIGMPIMFIDRLLNSVGFNCFPTGNKTVEVNGDAIVLENIVGSLTSLNTTDKSSLVNAINEVYNNVVSKKTQLLWGNGSETTGTFNLTDSIYNYDYLLVTYGAVGNGTLNTAIVTPWNGAWRLNVNNDFNFYAISGYVNGYFSSATSIVIQTNTPNVAIRMIYGVKA